MMKYLQKLGKSLMLPVACLPVCGILMGLGYAMCKQTMQGGDIEGVIPIIGFFLVKAGGALIDNMSWLFAIGVAVGMSDDHEGTAALSGLVSWLMITNLLSSATVGVLVGGEADPAFAKIQNQFIGILAGLIGATCYNKFKKGEIKDYQITKNDVLKFSKLKPNKCLFTSIVVDKSYQNGIVLLKLMQAFKEGMINKQIQVSHIIMDCVSDIGNKCANYIKAKLICKTNDSNIYELIVNKSR